MRISSLNFLQGPVESMTRLQGEVARTQSQLSSGQKLLNPADDPVAAGRVQELERWLLAAEQQQRNADSLGGRLVLQESALADASDLLQRMQELGVQGGNGALDESLRRMLAIEVRSRAEQLLQVANRRSPSGEYLFAGARTGTEPFDRQGGAVAYAGDEQLRTVEIAPGQRIADGFAGSELFMAVPRGNGQFALRAAATNAGTGVLGAGSVVSPAAWVPGDYEIEFTAAGAWEARDGTGSLVASGNRAAGQAIEFRGIRVALTGDPVVGDRFIVEGGGTEDLFATVDRLARALEAPVGDAAQRTAVANELNAVTRQLGQSLDHLLNARSVVGVRLGAIDYAQASRAALKEDVTTSLSGLRDADYAELITRLNAQMNGLQAAQQSYARIARLSLFDYL
jgi:flagellar hook-associated protein 3 FlgL